MNAAVNDYLTIREGLVLPGQGTDWIDALRETGRRRLMDVGFPTLRDENWRYTNIRPIQKQTFTPVVVAADGGKKQDLGFHPLSGLDACCMVFVDGHYSAAFSDVTDLPPGVVLSSMAAALRADAEGVRACLDSCVPDEGSGFVALNTAFVEDGFYLRVGRDCTVSKPIEVLFYNSDTGGQLVQPRNLIVVEPGGKVNVVERYLSDGKAGHLTNSITELIAHDSARVEHTRLQEESVKAFNIGGVFLHLHSGANAVSNNIALGSLIARTDLYVAFKGENASANLNGVYLANGRQHIDNFTQVDHEQPSCSSDEFYKGVLDNRARAVFHGRVVVHKDAQHTDAQQQNRNLLLSEDAEIDTKPQLEIYADDVKCSHGATVGQLDEDAMYYLRTRAIDETTARSLLTYAFAADVIGRFGLKPIRDHVEGVLSRKLFGVDRLDELV